MNWCKLPLAAMCSAGEGVWCDVRERMLSSGVDQSMRNTVSVCVVYPYRWVILHFVAVMLYSCGKFRVYSIFTAREL